MIYESEMNNLTSEATKRRWRNVTKFSNFQANCAEMVEQISAFQARCGQASQTVQNLWASLVPSETADILRDCR